MADHVVVKLKDIETAIFDGIADNRELRRAFDDFVDDVEEMWKRVWQQDSSGVLARETGVNHPYQTGDYIQHIKKRKLPGANRRNLRKMLHQGIFIGMVYNDSDVAHFIEYGTDVDNPDSRSPWGPFTPTPEFAPMRKTHAIMEAVGDIE